MEIIQNLPKIGKKSQMSQKTFGIGPLKHRVVEFKKQDIFLPIEVYHIKLNIHTVCIYIDLLFRKKCISRITIHIVFHPHVKSM